ncbi:MAG: hypothetical protein ACYDCL_22110 [Myxococcales bacterium]
MRRLAPLVLALLLLAPCRCVQAVDGLLPEPDGGCATAFGLSEVELWQTLAAEFVQCAGSHSTADCRDQAERQEWGGIPGAGASTFGTLLVGTVAPGGSTYSSPEVAPEGDLCFTHDDIDWNLNVAPDPAFASLLQPGNLEADADHPAGVVEAEWEAMYLDPAFVAWPGDGGGDYHGFARPAIDMADGDRVALRGAGVLDCGHAPFRSELHPPYLALWGGPRDGGVTVVHARASAQLTRPADFAPLPDPPEPSEALAADFPLPPDGGGVLDVTVAVDWLLDAPQIVPDQGCALSTDLGSLGHPSPNIDLSLASPAAHLEGGADAGEAFFALAAGEDGGRLWVQLTPLARPHQAIYGATVTAAWVPPDAG